MTYKIHGVIRSQPRRSDLRPVDEGLSIHQQYIRISQYADVVVISITIVAPVIIYGGCVTLSVIDRIGAGFLDLIPFRSDCTAIQKGCSGTHHLASRLIEGYQIVTRSAEPPALHVRRGISTRALNISIFNIWCCTCDSAKGRTLYLEQRLLAVLSVH